MENSGLKDIGRGQEGEIRRGGLTKISIKYSISKDFIFGTHMFRLWVIYPFYTEVGQFTHA